MRSACMKRDSFYAATWRVVFCIIVIVTIPIVTVVIVAIGRNQERVDVRDVDAGTGPLIRLR
jgi:hypothetical protein